LSKGKPEGKKRSVASPEIYLSEDREENNVDAKEKKKKRGKRQDVGHSISARSSGFEGQNGEGGSVPWPLRSQGAEGAFAKEKKRKRKKKKKNLKNGEKKKGYLSLRLGYSGGGGRRRGKKEAKP